MQWVSTNRVSFRSSRDAARAPLHPTRRRRTGRGAAPKRVAGFSLIELLVSIGLISLLVGIVVPTLSKSRTQSRVLVCTMNTRQITTAMLAYAADNRGYFVEQTTVGDDSLVYLHQQGYLSTPQVAFCPSTRNSLDAEQPEAMQLRRSAPHANAASAGHSYETFHHYSHGKFPGFTINDRSLMTTRDVVPPDQAFIVLDSDNDPDRGGMNGSHFGYNNLPDEGTNNHGQTGMNIAFLDGGSRFVPADQWIAVNIASGHMDGLSTDMVRAQRLYEPRLQWAPRNDGGPGLRYWLD